MLSIKYEFSCLRQSILLCLFMIQGLICFGQNDAEIDSIDQNKIGAELKAMAIGGGSMFVGATSLALLYNSSRHPEDQISPRMVPGVGIAMAVPSSLVSAGLAYIIGNNHSATSGNFGIGIGWATTTVDHNINEEHATKNWYHGIELRITTPSIGPIRYSLSYNRYFPFEYTTFDAPGQSEYWEYNIDMQFMMGKRSLQYYPFIGSSLFAQHNQGIWFYEGDAYDEVYTDIGFNVGIGFEYRLNDHLSIYSEPKLTISEETTQWYISLGSAYRF